MDDTPQAARSGDEQSGAYAPYDPSPQPPTYNRPDYIEPGPQTSVLNPQSSRGNLVLMAVVGAVVGALIMSLALVGVGFLGKPSSASTSLVEGTKVGNLAPNFDLEVLGTDERLTLKDLRGKAVWVNFWATWCPPCREEMPQMQRLYEQHRARGLEIVGVDVQESAEQVRGFTTELGLTWRFVLDRDGKTTDRYLVSGLPTHYFIDREGVIQAVHIGGLETIVGVKAPVDEYLEKILGR